uniref:Uncharacterized protein n=2 Tax=Anguilla anguilla TaxID=7936 RepID=A0A0E9U2M2_ANGAN
MAVITNANYVIMSFTKWVELPCMFKDFTYSTTVFVKEVHLSLVLTVQPVGAGICH